MKYATVKEIANTVMATDILSYEMVQQTFEDPVPEQVSENVGEIYDSVRAQLVAILKLLQSEGCDVARAWHEVNQEAIERGQEYMRRAEYAEQLLRLAGEEPDGEGAA